MVKNRALFQSAKDIAFISLMTALLIAAQLALSMVAGVEIVTVLFLGYCYAFGVRRGIFVAIAFSLLRCFVFGFSPTALILYLVYYDLFAVVFGVLAPFNEKQAAPLPLVQVVLTAAVMTILFTLLDDVITPLFYGYSSRAALVYFYNSLIVMATQSVCTVVTVSLLFVPLRKAFGMVAGKRAS